VTAQDDDEIEPEVAKNGDPPDLDDDSPESPRVPETLVTRWERRRMDLFSHDGIMREHERLFRHYKAGRLGVKRFDTASRALHRQVDMLRSRDAKLIQDREQADAARVVEHQESNVPTLGDFYRSLRIAKANGELPIEVPPTSTERPLQ
jgi:hypothetical protein